VRAKACVLCHSRDLSSYVLSFEVFTRLETGCWLGLPCRTTISFSGFLFVVLCFYFQTRSARWHLRKAATHQLLHSKLLDWIQQGCLCQATYDRSDSTFFPSWNRSHLVLFQVRRQVYFLCEDLCSMQFRASRPHAPELDLKVKTLEPIHLVDATPPRFVGWCPRSASLTTVASQFILSLPWHTCLHLCLYRLSGF